MFRRWALLSMARDTARVDRKAGSCSVLAASASRRFFSGLLLSAAAASEHVGLGPRECVSATVGVAPKPRGGRPRSCQLRTARHGWLLAQASGTICRMSLLPCTRASLCVPPAILLLLGRGRGIRCSGCGCRKRLCADAPRAPTRWASARWLATYEVSLFSPSLRSDEGATARARIGQGRRQRPV